MSDPFVFGAGHHASKYVNTYSDEDNASFMAQFGAITQQFVDAMNSGLSPADDTVQSAVKAHYEFCCKFWTPTRSAYKSLGLSYVLPTPYRQAYENVKEGLGQYTYDAVVLWADAHLRD